MQVLVDQAGVDALSDPVLRSLITRRLEERDLDEPFQADLHGSFVVMAPDDDLQVVEAAIGTSLLKSAINGAAYGDPAFVPVFEYVGRHAQFYEMVFITGDGDQGVTLLIPRQPDVEPRLLALCAEYAVTEPAAP